MAWARGNAMSAFHRMWTFDERAAPGRGKRLYWVESRDSGGPYAYSAFGTLCRSICGKKSILPTLRPAFRSNAYAIVTWK